MGGAGAFNAGSAGTQFGMGSMGGAGAFSAGPSAPAPGGSSGGFAFGMASAAGSVF